MEENTGVGIRVAAGIFLTIMLITIVVIITISSQDAAKQGQTKMAAITTQLSDTEYQTYSNTVLSGSQVLNAIRQYMNQDEFGIQVITGKQYYANSNTSGTFYGQKFNLDARGVVTSLGSSKSTSLYEAELQSSVEYINPSGKFISSIVRDDNNMIRGIKFEQQR
ncbi:ABC transporter permease [Paenibacillus barcinonensis]|uniref:ABC transporter permease n=1 Tax=Paenibacillus barcinonensis TaxID=198119 RepID=UPI001C1085C4|nr:ABC transporter permease [Paenibacillus barcinonensis]MBU5354939.1 ABC transporter permease [Paenibacillus barcinonensis]